MAEALGVASGIVGILSLTIQITQIVVQFGLDWKDAPKEAKTLMSELQSLKIILSETQTNLLLSPDLHDAFENRFSILLAELGPNAPPTTDTKLSIKSCESELNHLLDELRKRGTGSRMGWERLKTPFCAKSLQKSVDKVHRQCRSLNDMISIDALSVGVNTLGEVKQMRKEQQAWHELQDNQKVLSWLSDLSFADKHKDVCSKRYPSTGEWFLELDSFKAWRDGVPGEPSIMWCTGIPGAGKSVMTSIVIEHLREMFIDEYIPISYIYCDYKDRKNQTSTNLLGSLVKQTVSQVKEMPEHVRNLHAKCTGLPSLKDYVSLLSSISTEFKRSFILVDALDEHFANEDDEYGLEMTFLDELLQLQRRENAIPGLSIFLTSRENLVLQERIGGCVRAEIHAKDEDIRMYLRSRIYDHTKFRFASKVREDPELAGSITKSLSEKAQGMFLLPRLHLDRLSSQTSVRGLRAALNSLPTKLDDVYDEAIVRIQGQVSEHCELAKLALAWISNALRPLQVLELQHALAVRPGDRDLDPEAIPDIALVVSVSAGLIMIDPESQAVRLVHFTVEEYFKKNTTLFPQANILIAETCITYLSSDQLKNDSLSIDDKSFGFLNYAADSWGIHIHGDGERVLQNQVLDFLSDDQNLKYAKPTLQDTLKSRDFYYYYESLSPSRFHVIVYYDLAHILSVYLEKGYVSGTEDESLFSSLHLAVVKGRKEIVKILLDQENIDVNYVDEQRGTPLTVAAETGSESIAGMLLDRNDVRVNDQDRIGRTALSIAAGEGYKGIVKMLLDRDDVIADSKDQDGRTPLSRAAERGYEGVVRMLLNRDDVAADSKDRNGRTPLWRAAEKGHEGIVRILLNRDDVVADSEDRKGVTPLMKATRYRKRSILDRIFSRSRFNRNPTGWKRYESIVKMLLGRNDVNPDHHDLLGRTPLWYAARYGLHERVKLLIEREDVNLERKDKEGTTPLSVAKQCGHELTITLLEKEISRRRMIEGSSKKDNSKVEEKSETIQESM